MFTLIAPGLAAGEVPADGTVCYGYEVKHVRATRVADGDCPDETVSTADATNCKAGCELWLVPNTYVQEASTVNSFAQKYRCTLSSAARRVAGRPA